MGFLPPRLYREERLLHVCQYEPSQWQGVQHAVQPGQFGKFPSTSDVNSVKYPSRLGRKMTQLGTCTSIVNLSSVLERKMNFRKVWCLSEEPEKSPLNLKKKKKMPKNWAYQMNFSRPNLFTDWERSQAESHWEPRRLTHMIGKSSNVHK